MTCAQDFSTDMPIGSFLGSTSQYGLLDPKCRAYSAYGGSLGVYPTGPVSGGGLYCPERTLSVKNSVLDVYMHLDPSSGKPLSAAFSPFSEGRNTNEMTYGRWSWRMRSWQATGKNWGWVSELWPTIDAAWPQSGEIDWPEGDITGESATNPVGGLGGWYHPAGYPLSQFGQRQVRVGALNGKWSNWHTFTMEWLPGSLKLFMNQYKVLDTRSGVPNTPMRWVSQCGPNDPGYKPSGSAHMQIDWITAYRPA